MLWAWLSRLLLPARAPSPRLVTISNRLDDVDERIDYLAGELKTLRGRLTGAIRKEKVAEDAPSATIDDEPSPHYPPVRQVPATAHLARRFRSA